MKWTRYSAAPAAIALVFLVSGCGRNPEVQKQAHFQRAEAHFAKQEFGEAVVEYRNAIKYDGRFGRAFYRLGECYEKQGMGAEALGAFVRAADLIPDDSAVQLTAVNYLIAAERFQDAKERALKVLEREPRNAEAMVLAGNASAGLRDFTTAARQLQDALHLDPSNDRIYNNLGWFQALGGQKVEAEQVFRRAVQVAPDSARAHTALANYLFAVGNREEAERALRTAVSLDPASVDTNRALGWLLAVTGRGPEAEPFLRAAAARDPAPDGSFLLAEYYAWSGRQADAVKVLEDLRKSPATLVEADTRLAALLGRGPDKKRARDLVAEALGKAPRAVGARILAAEFALEDGKKKEALDILQDVVKDAPRSAAAQFSLGRVLTSLGRTNEAADAFRETLKLNPRATTAQLYLGRLLLQNGDGAGAAALANELLTASPGNPAARLLLADSQRATGDLAKADALITSLARDYPKWPAVQMQLSKVAVARGDWPRARQALDALQALSPDALEVFEGRLAVDIGSKRPDAARARISERLAKAPADPRVLTASAQAYLAIGDFDRAEDTAKRLVKLDPAQLGGYDLLGQVYLRTGKLEEAETQFVEIAKNSPNEVYALTLSAMLAAANGRDGVARERYERVLSIDPNSAAAANNLAWMYARDGENLDIALQLAQTAKRVAPTNPDVLDTLGFVLLKKGLYSGAVAELQEAALLMPRSATVQLHLAEAYQGTGNKTQAQRAAERALTLNPSPAEAERARHVIERVSKSG